MVVEPLVLDVFRPTTDNDAENVGREWKTKFVDLVKAHTRSIEWSMADDKNTATVNYKQRIAPPVLEWAIDTTIKYTFKSDSVSIKVEGLPQGKHLPSCFPRLSFTPTLTLDLTSVRWFGRGPGESYRDKKLSQLLGTYKASVEGLWTPYEFPQESGNRTDVRWVTFSTQADERRLSARFLNRPQGFNLSASHCREFDIEAAKHPYELERRMRGEVIIRLDWDHNGLGTGSCGKHPLMTLL